MNGRLLFKSNKKGYALLTAIIAVNIFAILILMARSMWETQLTRDLEDELLFRARQYKIAIELYQKKNNNLSPKELKDLLKKDKKKFIRKLYKDPMSEDGKWNIVMQGTGGRKKSLLIVPEEMVPEYLSKARIVGVASTSPEEGFKVYRGKKRYSEWAVYVGEKIDKEMPELKFAGEEDDDSGGNRDNRDSGGSGKERD